MRAVHTKWGQAQTKSAQELTQRDTKNMLLSLVPPEDRAWGLHSGALTTEPRPPLAPLAAPGNVSPVVSQHWPNDIDFLGAGWKSPHIFLDRVDQRPGSASRGRGSAVRTQVVVGGQ